jgi:hypothetical protein
MRTKDVLPLSSGVLIQRQAMQIPLRTAPCNPAKKNRSGVHNRLHNPGIALRGLCATCEKPVQSRRRSAIRKGTGQRFPEMTQIIASLQEGKDQAIKWGARNPICASARIHNVGGSMVNAPASAGHSQQSAWHGVICNPVRLECPSGY